MEFLLETRNGLHQSIPELVSELRATFLTRDFDRIEHALLERESMLKSQIEDKDKEIDSLKEKIELVRLDMVNLESELKRLNAEKHVKKEANEEGFDFIVGNVCEKCQKFSALNRELDDEKSVVAELRKRNGELEGEMVELLEEKKKWIGEKGVINGLREENKRLEEEKRCAEQAVMSWRRKCCELGVNGKLVVDDGGGNIVMKNEMSGIDGDGLGKRDENFGISYASARVSSGMRAAIEIQDSDEDECNLQGTTQRKETTAQLPGEVGINKMNLLDGLDVDTSSSSSSSSGSLDMDNLPLNSMTTSRKRMRTWPFSPR